MPIPEARLSATILLVRDAEPELEVFMVERHHQIDFATGALVFPGGKVDPGDASEAVRARCRAIENRSVEQASLWVAAIRETFEECGVLLARERGQQTLVRAERLAELEARYRGALQRGNAELAELVEGEDLELATDLLVPFAHWITPTFMPRRFDTLFFLCAAPTDQLALHDGEESVDSRWTTPTAALAAAKQGEAKIIFPTRVNLQKLGQSRRVAEALEAARTAPVVRVLPTLAKTPEGEAILEIPEDAGYAEFNSPLSEID